MLPWTRKIYFSKKALIVFSILVVFLFLGFTQIVSAQTNDTLGINQVQQSNIALTGIDIRVVVVKIINTVLSLLGIVLLSLIIYAGFVIMTAGGDEGKIANGKKIIVNAIIGLVIILSAFAIVKFVSDRILGATGFNRGTESTGQGPNLLTFTGSGALGDIVRDHYPFRDQKDVARNTAVVVTFNIPIDPASIAFNTNRDCWIDDFSGPTTTCKDTAGNNVTETTQLNTIVNPYYGDCFIDNNNTMFCDTLNTSTIKIDTSTNIINATAGIPASVVASYDENRQVFTVVFRPVDYLGSSTENVDYTVKLLDGILRADNKERLFPLGRPYVWEFQTGTNLDLTPPHVVSVSPSNGSNDAPKNRIISINFDEAIDPSTVQGRLSWDGNFDNILLNTTSTGQIEDRVVTGTWKISNGYRTVEFIPPDVCGQNSCGDTMYCLPVTCNGEGCLQDFSALVRTAQWSGNADRPFEARPFTGVYDMSFNALDKVDINNFNKPPVVRDPNTNTTKIIFDGEKVPDNYFWAFQIENKIDNQSPYIKSITPPIEGENVVGEAPVNIIFSKILRFGTIHGVGITEYPSGVCVDAASVTSTQPCSLVNETLPRLSTATFAENIGEEPNIVTKLDIKHRTFGPNGLDLYYFPTVTSTLQDQNQNCFYPGYGPKNNTDECVLDYDADGNVTNADTMNCVSVNIRNGSQDTACLYSVVTTTSNINSCLDILGNSNISQFPSNYIK